MFFSRMINTKKLRELQRNKGAIIRELPALGESQSLNLKKQEMVEKEIHTLLDTDLKVAKVSTLKISAETEIILESFTG